MDAALAGVNDIVAAAREVPGTGGGRIRKVSGTGGGQIRKVSGTGGGQIGEGVVVVGNVMFAFPTSGWRPCCRCPTSACAMSALS